MEEKKAATGIRHEWFGLISMHPGRPARWIDIHLNLELADLELADLHPTGS